MVAQIIRLYFIFLRLLFIQSKLPSSKFFLNIMCFLIYLFFIVPISLLFSKKSIKNKLSFQNISLKYNRNSFKK